MRTLRFLFSTAATLALLGGYLGSQYFAFSGRASEWARMVDTPAVQWIALFTLMGAILLALVPDREETA